MSKIEQAVQAALQGRLVAMGISPKAIARLAPRAVITRQGKDFLIGYLCWRDGAGEEIEGPEIEVSLSRALGDERLIADFVRVLIDTCTIPPERPAQSAAVTPLKTTKAAGTEPLLPPEPGFLIGAPGPGLAHLHAVLSTHPAICGGAESQFFALFGDRFELAERMAQHDSSPGGPLAYCGGDSFAQSLRRLWSEIFAGFHAAHPAALLHLDRVTLRGQTLSEVHRLFPKAPILFLAGAGQGGLAAAQTWQRSHPAQPFLLIHEADLQADPRATLARVLDFLLPADVPRALDSLLAAHAAARAEPGGGAQTPQRQRRWIETLMPWRSPRKKLKGA